MVAAVLRLAALGYAPPGLNQDEASNAWNAYCLLKTGTDQAGVSWPLFYTRCLGENRTTLFIYLLIPFQAIGGLNVHVARLPSAIGGVVAVFLVYLVGRRLFGRTTGLVAAAMLAINPWHIQQSRWGHEAAICPLLALLPVAILLLANLPFGDDSERQPRIGLAALGGLALGICCYGYPAVRLFLPVFITLAILGTLGGWWSTLKNRHGLLAIVAMTTGTALTFGPLAWKHLTDENIARRGKATQVWDDTDPTLVKIKKILARYPGHFGPDFLFINGDRYEIQSTPGFGQFHWYDLPLMLAGLIVLTTRAVSSRAARVLLIWVIVYPVGDLVGTHFGGSMHALRSLPGLPGLILLGAVGAVWSGETLWRRSRPGAVAAGCLAAVVVVALNLRFLVYFFGEYNSRPQVYHSYHVDLLRACDWLRPRLKNIDAVFCTTTYMNMPYIVSLVGLAYEPRDWFQDSREIHTIGPWDVYTRYGKMNFLYGRVWPPMLKALQENGRPDRVIFIVRPRESPFKNPIHEIRGPEGTAPLWICEQQL